jgi:Tfp pilus assembly protein PilO
VALAALFEPLVNAPRWQKLALGLMGLAIVGAGGYFLVLSPLEIRVNTLRAQHASVQRELLEARAAAADVARFRREAAELERRLDVLKARLPTDKEMPPLFRTLTDSAFQSGLLVSLFQPKDGRVHEFLLELCM